MDHKSVRWQNLTISQLTNTINMILGLATGSLGFLISLMLEHKFKSNNPKIILIAAALALTLTLTIFSMVICYITRLLDFRITAKITRNISDTERIFLQSKTKKLGQLTWGLWTAPL